MDMNLESDVKYKCVRKPRGDIYSTDTDNDSESLFLREMQTFVQVPRKLSSMIGRKVVASRHDDVRQGLVGRRCVRVKDAGAERIYQRVSCKLLTTKELERRQLWKTNPATGIAGPGEGRFGFEELHDLVGHVRTDDGELLQVWESVENPSKVLCAHV